MDGGVSPGGGMPQARLIPRHPIVLQDPVRNQVRQQAAFEGGHRGIKTGRTAGSAETVPVPPRGVGRSKWPVRLGGRLREPLGLRVDAGVRDLEVAGSLLESLDGIGAY